LYHKANEANNDKINEEQLEIIPVRNITENTILFYDKMNNKKTNKKHPRYNPPHRL
jgi:hypothetical protein